MNRPLTVTAGTAVTQYSYPAGATVVTDPQNHVTRYDYSAYGDPAAAHLALVTDAAGKFTRYSYDKFGNLATVNGPNATGAVGSSPQRSWSYDHRNFLTTETQPEKGTTTYGYDNAGNVTQITDAAGTAITLTYDENNRLWARNAPGTRDDLEIKYTPTSQIDVMASPTIAAAKDKTMFGYFPLTDHVSWRTDIVYNYTLDVSYTFSSSYTYHLNDAINVVTYPSSRPVEHVYNSTSGRLSSIKYNGTTFADNFAYGDNGRLSGYRTGVVNHTIHYDDRQRLDRITAGPQPSGLDLTYRYNDGNEIYQIDNTRNGSPEIQTFDYDAVGRLWAADGPWGALRWEYDPAGNRTKETRGSATHYVYDAPTQRLTSTWGAVAETFSYDAAGRLTSDSRGTYTYNARGLLATATKTSSGLSASYDYDPAGLRAARTVTNQTAYTVRSAGNQAITEFASPCGAAPVWARDVIYAGGRLLGAVRANPASATVAMPASTASVAESATSINVGVQLTTPGGAPSTCAITVGYETTAGTATVGSDFTSTGGVLTFPAGTASGTILNIGVPLLPDSANEPLETFTVLLSTASGAKLGSFPGQTVTITDDDLAPAMAIEQPVAGNVRTPVTVSGWAIDESSPTGTGIDLIHVYATPTGGSAQFLGAGTYGQSRPDVATAYGDSRFTNSGYSFVANLTPGAYTLTVYAFRGGVPQQNQTVLVTVAAADPHMALELPSQPGATLPQPVTLSGWAIDTGTSSGTGVSSVRVLAYLNGTGTPTALGNATYGSQRNDVAAAYAAYGSGFGPSGFSMQVRGLAPGTYKLVAEAFSTVSQSYNQSRDITITVTANPQGWIDVPGPSSTQNQSVTVMGWAADFAAGSGTGVNNVHLWVLPNPGSGTPAQFFGAATYGAQRTDVEIAYGSQFLNSGYSFTGTLAPGPYQLQAFAWSTVLNTWATAQTTTFTGAASNPQIAIDTPAASATVGQPFTIAGWAIDLGAPSGTGIQYLHVYAKPSGSVGQGTFLGFATYGGSRPDIGSYYGPQFTNSGYGFSVSGLSAGIYDLGVWALSTVSGQWSVQYVTVTVQ